MSDSTFVNPNSTITSYIVKQGEKVPSPELYLTNPNRNILGKIADANNKNLTINFTTPNELTLSIPYQITVDNKLERNKIVDLLRIGFLIKLVFAGIETWYIISKSEPNSDAQDWLNVQCYSLEYELTHKKIIGYKQTSYNCLQVLEDALNGTGWTVGYINDEFNLKYKQFDVSSSTRLDFINQICTTFDAYAIYDTVNKKVNICKEEEVSQYKGFWIEYGKYLQNISQSIDNDEAITRLHVTGSNNVTINSVNPTGQDYIDDFSFYLYPFDVDENGNITEHSYYMTDDLCIAIINYNNIVDSNATKFSELLATRKQLQTDLTTLQTDMSTLKEDLQQILDNIQIAKDNNQPTKDLISQRDNKQKEIDNKQVDIDKKQSEIKVNDTDISNLNNLLAFENNFTESQLEELTKYIHEDEFSDDNQINPEDLYEAGVKQLEKVSFPPINITLGIVNFFAILEEKHNWNRLTIGDIIRIRHDKLGIDVKATVNQLTFDFENNTISITVSNVKQPQTIQQKFTNALYVIDKVNTDYSNRKRDWNSLLTNFNVRNDRISAIPADPVLDRHAVSHKENDNASIDLTLTWSYYDYNATQKDEDNIDGFIIYMYSDTTSDPYTFGSKIASETVVPVSYDKRAYTFPSLPPNRYYTLGIAAYRNVDNDIATDGVLFSNIVTPKNITSTNKITTLSIKKVDPDIPTIEQTAYLPSTTVSLKGDVNGIKYDTSFTKPNNPIVNKSVWVDINTKKVYIYTTNGWETDDSYLVYTDEKIADAESKIYDLQTQTDASIGNLQSDIDAFSSDGMITLAEANTLKAELTQLNSESQDIITTAEGLLITIEKVDYQNALADLNAELGKWIDQPNYPLKITSQDRDNITMKLGEVQRTKSILVNKITEVRQAMSEDYTDQQVYELNGSLGTLGQEIDDFSSDGKITLAEANSLKIQLAQVQKESEDVINIAIGLSITTEKVNYQNALYDLTAELSKWIDQSKYPIAITTFDRDNIKTKFQSVQNYKSILINKIASVREANATAVGNAAQDTADKAWGKFYGAGDTLPAGEVYFSDQYGNQVPSGNITQATLNFNKNNDRISTPPANPIVSSNGTAVNYNDNIDGSINISFEWIFYGSGDAANIDGFIVYVHQSPTPDVYFFGAQVSAEQVYYVTADKRSLILYGVPAKMYYTFGVQAYRLVDTDIAISGVIKSSIIKDIASGENPFTKTNEIAFQGDITNSVIDGTTAVTVKDKALGSLQYGMPYNNCTWGSAGFIAQKSDNKYRAIMNSDGFKLQKSTDGGNTWYSQLSADDYGNAVFSGNLSAASGTFQGQMNAGSININNQFVVNNQGQFQAKDAYITGTIYSDGSGPGSQFIYTNAIDTNPNTLGQHVYIRPLAGKEVRFTQTGTYDTNSIYVNARGQTGYFTAIDANNLGGAYNLYLRPQNGYEVQITSTGSISNYQNLRALGFYGNSLTINSAGAHLYIRPDVGREVRCTQAGTTDIYVPIHASNVSTSSLEEYKQDIKLWNDSALDIINNSDIYQYRLKTDVAIGRDKLEHGLVIGDGYKTPTEVLNNESDGVEQYEMNSISWKAIQELSQTIVSQQQQIDDLNKQNQDLILKLANLEQRLSTLESAK